MKSHEILDKALTASKRLYRADGTDTSRKAAEQVPVSVLEHIVYGAVKHYGRAGCIQDQVLYDLAQFNYNSITPRFRALLDKGLIEDTGERRKGNSGRSQRVLRVVK